MRQQPVDVFIVGATVIDWTQLNLLFAPIKPTEHLDKSGLAWTPCGAWFSILEIHFNTNLFFLSGYSVIIGIKGDIERLENLGIYPYETNGNVHLYTRNIEEWKQIVIKLSGCELGSKMYAKLEPIAKELFKDITATKNSEGWYDLIVHV